MTEEQGEQAHALKEQVYSAVHDLVDQMTDGIDPVVDDAVRQSLTETFRFWRRLCSVSDTST